jgi:hypothetical protein
MIMNANVSFTKDINIRRAIIHAIDKARFIEEEFAGLEQPVTQLLPYSAPYCNVDLSPKWAYDFDKAKRLNCPVPDPGKDGGLPGWATIVIIVISVALAAVLAFALVMYARERQGRPVFMPIDPEEETLVAKPEQGPEGPPPSQAAIGHTSPYPMAPAMNPHGFSVA